MRFVFTIVFMLLCFSLQAEESRLIKCDLITKNNSDDIYVSINYETWKGVLIGFDKFKQKKWSVDIPIEKINTDRAEVNCVDDQIEISWLMPFSTTEFGYQLKWNGYELVQMTHESQDQTSKELNSALSKAQNGEGVDWNIDIMYPDRYITSDTVEILINKGHKNSLKSYKSKNIKKSINILENTFDLSFLLSFMAGKCEQCGEGVDSNMTHSEKITMWLSVWDQFEIPSASYIPAFNDYGFFLQKAKFYKRSLNVFKEVIRIDATRVVVLLNIADSYWELAKFDSAKPYYLRYLEQMKKTGKGKRVPSRVLKRI